MEKPTSTDAPVDRLVRCPRDNYYLGEMWAGSAGVNCHCCSEKTWTVWLDAEEITRLDRWLATADAPLQRQRGVVELHLGVALCRTHAIEFCERLETDRPRSICDIATAL